MREGAGKTGYRLIPAVRVQQKARGRTTGSAQYPAFPARRFERVIRALPGDRLSCPRRQRIIITADLASAPGCQDHTISPSHRSVRPHDRDHAANRRAHRIPAPTFVTIAKRPSWQGRDGRKCAADLPDEASVLHATNWHDGQFAHDAYARVTRRVDAVDVDPAPMAGSACSETIIRIIQRRSRRVYR